MNRYLSLFLSVWFVAAEAAPIERKLYVGKDSTEAVMAYRSQVLFTSNVKPSEAKAREKIEAQIVHLFGPMGEAAVKSVPRGNHTVSDVKIEAKGNKRYAASYNYQGTIVLQNGPTVSYEIVLPVNPDTVYAAGAVKRGNTTVYPCTDAHYTSEGDFWYFWNPAKRGCPLKKGTDYVALKAKVKRVANTTVTYPEYHRLADNNGVIRIDILMGMDDPALNHNPLTSRDLNAGNYRSIRTSLAQLGFTGRAWSDAESRAVVANSEAQLPFVEEFEKKQRRATLVVRMFYGPTGIDEPSTAFHYFFKDALEHAAVMMYDGHSGLGGHLDLPAIEQANQFKFAISPNLYQIYFFNSCSSYTYYNSMYFKRKQTVADPKGTKQLDILTNGLATYFSVMHDTNLALVKGIDAWAEDKAVLSYQAVTKQIDSGNLFGVNGDEDNPTSPRDVQ